MSFIRFILGFAMTLVFMMGLISIISSPFIIAFVAAILVGVLAGMSGD